MNTADVVFNIQRFSLHDGPGIRATIFLKGCPMHCAWCHNPEGQHPEPEIRYYAERCIACGLCVMACPNHAHLMNEGVHFFLRERCETSGECVKTCYSKALELDGQTMTVARIMEEVLRDQAFYEISGGGVTLSGGEPAFSKDFALELLIACKEHRLHTAVETCGEIPWPALEVLLPLSDLVMMDLKQMNSAKHQVATGQSNDRIVANARSLALTNKSVVFRTPVVPTVNDSEEEIGRIASFVRELKELRKKKWSSSQSVAPLTYELLPFHKLASDKYRSLGREYLVADLEPPSKGTMTSLLEVANRHGIEASIR